MKGLNAKTARYVADCIESREGLAGPRIGDFLFSLEHGIVRFAHDWGEGLQVTRGGSFHLGTSGYASFSGGLEPSISKENIRRAYTQVMPGNFWVWLDGMSGADRGVGVDIECRVFEEVRK